jgi:hypothetical protein
MLTKEEPKYENWWADHPADDDRFRGLLRIANSIHDAFDLAAGEVEVVALSETAPSVHLVLSPLRLAKEMREAAARIERLTEGRLG